MKALAIIPARAGSQRIPHKNSVTMGGKPLIQWTIESAMASTMIGKIILCTDDPSITYFGDMLEVESCMPHAHDFDKGEASDAVISVLKGIEAKDMPDYVVMLLPTSPFRTAHHINEAIEQFRIVRPDSLISVVECPIEIRKVRSLQKSGFLCPQRSNLYLSNGAIQISTPEHLLKHRTFHAGDVIPYVMDLDDGIDIDTPEDLARAQHILEERHVTA